MEKERRLISACTNENPEECKKLVDSGIDINQTLDYFGQTPLAIACYKANRDFCQSLISLGANVNHIDNDGWTPLFRCSMNGRTECCELLISSGANINQLVYQRNAKGKGVYISPVVVACTRNYFGVVKLLLENGALITQDDLNIVKGDKYAFLLEEEKNRRDNLMTILLLEREFFEDSFFFKDNLPLDLFKLLLVESSIFLF